MIQRRLAVDDDPLRTDAVETADRRVPSIADIPQGVANPKFN